MKELQELHDFLKSQNKKELCNQLDLLRKIAFEESTILVSDGIVVSAGLQYHLDNQIPITQPIYRENTQKYYDLIIEAKQLFDHGKLFVDLDSVDFLSSDVGKFAEFDGMPVPLDAPMELVEEENVIKMAAQFQGKNVQLGKPKTLRKGDPGYGRKQYVVYVKDGDKVKRITFGDPNLKAKPEKAKNRKSFRARHKCDQKKDKTTPGYWACRYPPNW
jgi:hypothetical protein